MKMKWKMNQPDPNMVDRLVRKMGLHPLTARLISNRSIATVEDAARFLKPSFKDLPPPTLLKDI